MARFCALIAALLLYSGVAQALVLPQQTFKACGADIMLPPGISLPGPGITSASLVTLGCHITGTGPYCTGRLANALSGYVVPSGKTFRIFHACSPPGSSSTETSYSLIWSTADAGFDNGSPPAGIFWNYNYSTSDMFTSLVYGSPNQAAFLPMDVNSGKYPGAHGSARTTIMIYGYEY